jgi:hypothetical protein
MASIDAAINIVVSGQQKINSLLDSLSKVEQVTSRLEVAPINLSLSDVSKDIKQIESLLNRSSDSIAKKRKEITENFAKQADRYGDAIVKNVKIIQKAEESGRTSTKKYAQAVEARDRAIKGLAETQSKYSASLGELEQAEKNINDVRAGSLAGIKKQQDALRRLDQLTGEYIKKQNRASRIYDLGGGVVPVQIKSAAAAFKELAANSNTASLQFRKFTLAGATAEIESFGESIKRYQVLADALSGSRQNLGVQFEGPSDALRDLVAQLPNVAKSEAGLQSYRDKLEELRTLTPFASKNFETLGSAIKEVDGTLSRLKGKTVDVQQLAPSARGPAVEIGSVRAAKEQIKYDRDIKKTREDLFRISVEIDGILASQAQKDQLRAKLAPGFLAIDKGRLEVAQEIAKTTRSDTRIARRDFRDAQIQSDRKIKLEAKLGESIAEVGAAVSRLNAIQSGAYDNSDLESFLNSQRKLGLEQKDFNKNNELGGKIFDAQLNSAKALPEQLTKLKTIQNEYNKAKEKGAKFSQQEESGLARTIELLSSPSFKIGPGTQKAVGEIISKFQSIRRLRVSEVPTGGGTSPAVLEGRRNRLLENALKLQGSLGDLEGKGASVANERLSLEQRILELKQAQGKASQADLEILASGLQEIRTGLQGARNDLQAESQLSGFGKSFDDFKQALSGQGKFFGDLSPAQAIDKIVREFNSASGGRSTSAGGAGDAGANVAKTFTDSIKSGASKAASAATAFSEAAKTAIKKAFGIASPSRFMIELVANLANTYVAEMQKAYPRIQAATDRAFGNETLLRDVKTLRATNTGFEEVGRTSTGFRPFPVGASTEGASREFQNMMYRFRGDMAELTTQPEIYKALLNALPDSRLTTDLAGAASRRANAAENLPYFMQAQREIGPGELENQIKNLAAEYFRGIRIPNPWVGPVGDYEEFINKVIASTEKLQTQLALPSSRIAGALPPASQTLSAIQQARVDQALLRSQQRSTSILSSDRFGGVGQSALPAASFGFMADPARLARLNPVIGNRLLPPAIDTTARAVEEAGSAADDGRNSLRRAVGEFFSRLGSAVTGLGGGGGVFGGGGGRPPGGPGGPAGLGGPDDFGDRLGAAAVRGAEGLLSLAELQRPAEVSTARLNLLSGILQEVYNSLDPMAEGADAVSAQLRRTIVSLEELSASRAPDADFLTRRTGSPRRAAAISEGLIGGAFPLLFGQGAGAALGGGIGGAAGGFLGGGLGFGLSLAGTALGTAFDTLVQKAQELGGALDDTSKTFDVVKERSLFSTKEIEKLATRLQEAGLTASASALAQEEVFKKIGPEGISALQGVETEADRANRAFAELGIQLQVLVAGPVAFFLEKITGALKDESLTIRATEVGKRLRDVGETEQAKRIFNTAGSFETARTSPFRFLPGFSPDKLRKDLEAEIATGEFLVPVKFDPKIDPIKAKEQLITAFQSALDAVSKQLQALDIAKGITDQSRNAAREQQDLDRQRADLLRSYEESIASIRLGVERKVQQERLNNLRLENQVYEQQGEVRLQQLRNQNALISQTLNGNQVGQQLFDAVAQFTEQQLSAENEIANRRRNLEAEIQSINLEAQNYKIDVAKQVADLDKNTARQVESIRLNVLRKNQDFDKNRFEAEKKIALLRLNVEKVGAQKTILETKRILPGVTDQQEKNALQQVVNSLQSLLETSNPNGFSSLFKRIQSTSAPQQVSFGSASIGSNVSTAGLASVTQAGIELRGRIDDLQNQISDLVSSGNLLALNKSLSDIADAGAKDAIKAFEDVAYELGAVIGAFDKSAKSPALQRFAVGVQKAIFSPGVQNSPLRNALIDLLKLYEELAEKNEKLAETNQFFTSALERSKDEISSLKDEINSAIVGTSAYEQALISLAARGLSPASAQATLLLESSKELDRLRDKVGVFTQVSGAASEFSGSLRGLIEDFVELGSVSELATRFADRLGKKSLGFALDIAFKPIEQQFEKQFFKIAEALGVDVKPEALKQLEETQALTGIVGSIDQKIAALIQILTKNQLTQSFSPLEKTTASVIDQVFSTQSKELQSAVDQTKKFFASGPSAEDAKSALLEFDEYVNKRLTPAAKVLPTAGTREYFNLGMEKFYEDVRKARKEIFGLSVPEFIPSPPTVSPKQLPQTRRMSDQIDRSTNRSANDYPEIGKFVGGGPDLPDNLLGINSAFGLATEMSPVPVKIVGAGIEQLGSLAQALPRTAAQQVGPSADQIVQDSNKVGSALEGIGKNTQKAAESTEQGGNELTKGLGKAVSGVAGAAAGIAAIVSGLESMKEGGAYGVITGLAAVFGGIASITGSFAALKKAAKGAYFSGGMANFSDGNIRKFANGGTFTNSIVSSPTLFDFGEMGEAGPEAIMPLKRGSDGRLGVSVYDGTRKAAGVDTSSSSGSRKGEEERMMEFAATAAAVRRQAMLQEGEAMQDSEMNMMRQMLTTTPPLNIRYESQVINNVEYVTREQAERLASESAKKGKDLAIGTLQASVRTRKRVGIS